MNVIVQREDRSYVKVVVVSSGGPSAGVTRQHGIQDPEQVPPQSLQTTDCTLLKDTHRRVI